MGIVEILAPAGSYEAMEAASNAGCDAVYAGGNMFGARAYAANFGDDELLRAIDYMHLRGKRFYLTVNTLLKDEELPQLYDYLRKPYEEGLDAVIVQDTGVLLAVSEWFPELDIHASTQMTLTMAEGVNALAVDSCPQACGNGAGHADISASGRCNITRLVPARELGLDELRRLRAATSLEIETFVHGALCYCYSGQCLMSSMIGGRSGNRGRCAQPCRRMYKLEGGSYLLSMSDLSSLRLVPKLLETGIDSFKIEGRMKSPEYAAAVTAAYRRAVDMCLGSHKDDAVIFDMGRASGGAPGITGDRGYSDTCGRMEEVLKELYNRGGFTEGYYTAHNSSDMMSMERPNHCGVKVGEVAGAERGCVSIRLSSDVNDGDVLEIRQGEAVYEYTQKGSARAGAKITAKVYRSLRFSEGAQVYRTKNKLLTENFRKLYIEGRDPGTVFAGAECLLRRDNLNAGMCELDGSFRAAAGEKISLTLSGLAQVTVYGNIPDFARSCPVDEDSVRKSLEKLGGTCYVFRNLELSLQDGLFIPAGSLNALRRAAVEAYEEAVIGAHRREADWEAPAVLGQDDGRSLKMHNEDRAKAVNVPARPLSAKICTRQQLEAVCRSQVVERIYISIEDFGFETLGENLRLIADSGREAYLYLPQLCRSEIYDYLAANSGGLLHSDVSGYIVRNFEEYTLISGLLKEHGLNRELRLDYNMYVMNSMAKLFWRRKLSGIKFTLPLELNMRELKELSDSSFELIVYGRTALMASAQCVFRNAGLGCEKTGAGQTENIIYITDGSGRSMPVKRLCRFCMNVIYNSDCLELIGESGRLANLECGLYRLDFTVEDGTETSRVLDAYGKAFSRAGERMAGGNKTLLSPVNERFTRGHFNRGVG